MTLTGAGAVEGLTVTVADDLASETALFAVTVTELVVDSTGAVKSPPLEMMPAVVDQTTEVLLVPLTVAANCCVPPEITVALVGLTVTAIWLLVAGFTVTVAEAVEVGDATLVAVMVAYVVAVLVPAVKNPVLEIEPAVVDHATDVLVVPLTVAVNCCVIPELNVALAGET